MGRMEQDRVCNCPLWASVCAYMHNNQTLLKSVGMVGLYLIVGRLELCAVQVTVRQTHLRKQ